MPKYRVILVKSRPTTRVVEVEAKNRTYAGILAKAKTIEDNDPFLGIREVTEIPGPPTSILGPSPIKYRYTKVPDSDIISDGTEYWTTTSLLFGEPKYERFYGLTGFSASAYTPIIYTRDPIL